MLNDFVFTGMDLPKNGVSWHELREGDLPEMEHEFRLELRELIAVGAFQFSYLLAFLL